MKSKQISFILLMAIFLMSNNSQSGTFEKGEDYLSYVEDKLETIKFEEYDLTLMKIVEEPQLTDEEIKEKISQGMRRQEMLGMGEDNPEYMNMYNKYYELFKNNFSNRYFKFRMKSTPKFYLISDTQFDKTEIENGDFSKDFITTVIYDKTNNKKYRIQHNGKTILELGEDKLLPSIAVNQMLLPESVLGQFSQVCKRKFRIV